MNKSKVENGEVIEQEKRFLEWVKARDDDWWEDEARISIWDFRIMQEFFKEDITNALNQQRRDLIKEIFQEINMKRQGFVLESGHVHYGVFGTDLNDILTKLEK